MVFIDGNGRILQRRPWTLERFFGIIVGFFTLILVFFRTLFEPLTSSLNNSYNRRGGDDGGDGGGGGRKGPRPPERRIGRITTLSDCTIPGGG